MPKNSELLDQVRYAIHLRHMSYRTEQSYTDWIYRFSFFHHHRHPQQMGEPEVASFLSFLANERRVAASTQNQALQALLFLYQAVLNKPLSPSINFVRAKRPRPLPVVLTRPEVRQVLSQLKGEAWLMTSLLYGSGLRLRECLKLRIKDIDLIRSEILVYEEKGKKEHCTVLPQKLKQPLTRWIDWQQQHCQTQKNNGRYEVSLPYTLEKKDSNAPYEWVRQYVFPSATPSVDPRAGAAKLHHRSESFLQKAIKRAVRKTGIAKPVSCHTFRHSFATHLLEDGYGIRTVQELLGHKDKRSTMIYRHILDKSKHGVRSPLDR